jgi:hypothetical protein
MNWKHLAILLVIIVVIRYILKWAYYKLIGNVHESYIDLPLLLPKIPTGAEANDHFRKVIMYLEKNPTDAEKFLTFMQNNFFVEPCPLKDPGTWGRQLSADSTGKNIFKTSEEEEKKSLGLK